MNEYPQIHEILRIIRQYVATTDRNRAIDLHRFFLGKSKPAIIERMKAMFKIQQQLSSDDFFPFIADSVRRAIFQSSTIRLTKPEQRWVWRSTNGGGKRILDRDNPEDASRFDLIDQIMKALDWDNTMRELEYLANLHHSAGCHVAVSTKLDQPLLRILPRYKFDFVPDNDLPERQDLCKYVVFYNTNAEGRPWYTVYSPLGIWVLDEGGGLIDGYDQGKNPYQNTETQDGLPAFYPLTVISIHRPVGYPVPLVPDALYETHLNLNAMLADIGTTIRFQAFGQPWTKGLSKGNKPTKLGSRFPWHLGSGGECGFAAPPAIFSDGLDAIVKIGRMCAAMSNLSPNIWQDVAVERTGDAIMASRTDIEIERQRQVELWRDFEPALWRQLKRVVNQAIGENGLTDRWRIPAELELDAVFYQAPAYPVLNPQAEAQRDATDINSGVETVATVRQRRHGHDDIQARHEEERRQDVGRGEPGAGEAPQGERETAQQTGPSQ